MRTKLIFFLLILCLFFNSSGYAGEGTLIYRQILPIGSIELWPTTTPPTGWFLCDGSAVSRTTYAALFAVIGTTFGAGDGSTTFNLPNLKGRFSIGLNGADPDFDEIGETGGSKTATGSLDSGTQVGTYNAAYSKTTGNINIIPPYVVLNYIIKY